MFHSQLHAPMMRLITGALGVIATVNDGSLFHHQTDKEKARVVDAFDRLEQDVEVALKSLPKEVSPFLRYRMEILGNTIAGINLRYLVCHLSGDKQYQYFDIGRVVQELNTHHAMIALELLQTFAINPHDPTFLQLVDAVRAAVAKEESLEDTERVGA